MTPNAKRIKTSDKIKMGLIDPYYFKYQKPKIGKKGKKTVLIGFIHGFELIEIK